MWSYQSHASHRSECDWVRAGSGPEAFNRTALLRQFGPDRMHLYELIMLFLDEYPALIAAMRDAVHEGNSRKLHWSAHTLKGSAMALQAGPASEAAGRLEVLSRCGDLTFAPAQLAAVEREVARLVPALSTFADQLRNGYRMAA
jgi:HPt (histidine-containing phosphotransfer) domain-containing protein